ncbi:MAG: MFS transporter [archaeon]|nr:MFS transporter [archaeon]
MKVKRAFSIRDQTLMDELINQYGYGKRTLLAFMCMFFTFLLQGMEFTFFSIYLIPVANYFTASDFQVQMISSSMSVAVCLGTFSSGMISNKLNRTLPIYIFDIVLLISHFLMAFIKNIWTFTILRLVIGYSVGVISPMNYSIFTEYLPLNLRAFFLAFSYIGVNFGEALNSGLMAVVMPNLEVDMVPVCIYILETTIVISFILNLIFLNDSPRNLLITKSINEETEEEKKNSEKAFRILDEMKGDLKFPESNEKPKQNEIKENKKNIKNIKSPLPPVEEVLDDDLALKEEQGKAFEKHLDEINPDDNEDINLDKMDHNEEESLLGVGNLQRASSKLVTDNKPLTEYEKDRIKFEIKQSQLGSDFSESLIKIFNDNYLRTSTFLIGIFFFNYMNEYGLKLIYSLAIREIMSAEPNVNNLVVRALRILYFSMISASIICGVLCEIEYIGRKKTFLIANVVAFISIFLCTINTRLIVLWFSLCLISIKVSVVTSNLYTAEVYNTKIRNKALGLMLALGRSGAFFSQILFILLHNIHVFVPFYFTFITCIVNSIFSVSLPFETYGRKLEECVGDEKEKEIGNALEMELQGKEGDINDYKRLD